MTPKDRKRGRGLKRNLIEGMDRLVIGRKDNENGRVVLALTGEKHREKDREIERERERERERIITRE